MVITKPAVTHTSNKRKVRNFRVLGHNPFAYIPSEEDNANPKPKKKLRSILDTTIDLHQLTIKNSRQVEVGHVPTKISDMGFFTTRKFYHEQYSTIPIPEPGPTTFQPYNEGDKPIDLFLSWMKPFFEHVIEETNKYCAQENIRELHTEDIFELDTICLHNHTTLFLAAGLIQCRNYEQYWENPESHFGLIGNQFFIDTMGHNMFHKINRCIHINREYAVELHNEMSHDRRYPGASLSFDDDKFRWTGRGGFKKKNDKKADKTGIDSYKIVDKSGYCYGIVFEDTELFVYYRDQGDSYHMAMIKSLDDLLRKGAYTIYIDAGVLSGLDVCDYLAKQGRKFVVMTPQNKGLVVWDLLQRYIYMYQWKCLYHKSYVACSYYAKKGKNGKSYCNLVFNFNDGAEMSTVTNYNRTTGDDDNVGAPKALSFYRTDHTMVDSRKGIINHVRNTFRLRRPFRVVYSEVLYSLAFNSYVNYCSLAGVGDDYTFAKYLLDVISALRHPHAEAKNRQVVPSTGIIYHPLSHSERSNRCRICQKKRVTYCAKCGKDSRGYDIHLCEGICAIRFHNPNVTIIKE